MSEPPALVVGRESSAHIRIEPYGWEFPEALDRDDANWLCARITVRVGGFHGGVQAALLRADDFGAFRADLAALQTSLSGTATFSTLEGWVNIEILGDGKGHMDAKCSMVDNPGLGNELRFMLAFDQTDVPPMLAGLDAITAAFPPRGMDT